MDAPTAAPPAELLAPDFPETLAEPLRTGFRAVLATAAAAGDGAEGPTGAGAAADELERLLRAGLLELLAEEPAGADRLKQVGQFWRECLRLCLHVAATEDQTEAYRALGARRLPFLLLEDAAEALTVEQVQALWHNVVEPGFPLLFADALWAVPAAGKSNPAWLPFLKLCNHLIRRLDATGAARIMLTLAQVFPLSDKSATVKWGSRGTEALALPETEEEFLREQQQEQERQAQATTPEGLRDNLSYNFYEAFWSLQKDFASTAIPNLASFISRLKSVLDSLEAQRPDGEAATLSSLKLDPSVVALLSGKYLVSSRLLPLQLTDARFRTCILTQFLIVAHHLALEAPSVGAQLAPLRQRARQLLPEDYLSMMDRILDTSELQWRSWKKNRCPDLETLCPANNGSSDSSRKRKYQLEEAPSAKDDASGLNESVYRRIGLRSDLPAICRGMRELVPSIEDHLSDYVEALDPDAGIEAEYHPKNDAFFNWQALRLLSHRNLRDFDRLHSNGDYEAMIRHSWQRDKDVIIPGEAPEYVDKSQEEDDVEESQTQDAANDDEAAVKEEDSGDVVLNDAADEGGINDDAVMEDQDGDSQETTAVKEQTGAQHVEDDALPSATNGDQNGEHEAAQETDVAKEQTKALNKDSQDKSSSQKIETKSSQNQSVSNGHGQKSKADEKKPHDSPARGAAASRAPGPVSRSAPPQGNRRYPAGHDERAAGRGSQQRGRDYGRDHGGSGRGGTTDGHGQGRNADAGNVRRYDSHDRGPPGAGHRNEVPPGQRPPGRSWEPPPPRRGEQGGPRRDNRGGRGSGSGPDRDGR